MEKNRQKHKKTIEKYCKKVFTPFNEKYWGNLQYEINLNDDSDTNCTAFEIRLTNGTNKKHRFVILQADDDGVMEMLMGEEFQEFSTITMWAWLFLNDFVTYEG